MAGYKIQVKNLQFKPPKSNDKGILRNISFSVNRGEFVSFIGRNGHGKSSIFRAISGELNYTKGQVTVANINIDSPIHKHCDGVGIVHQYVQDDLITELSILKNIQIRQLFSNDKKVRKDASDTNWLSRINTRLSEFLSSDDFKPTNDTLVEELSGGQRQLLNVLIALEFEHSSEIGCRLLMLDEHLTSLDVKIQKKVMELISKLTKKLSNTPTILMITHDFNYALEYSDKIIVIYEGEVKEIIRKRSKEKWTINYLNSII